MKKYRLVKRKNIWTGSYGNSEFIYVAQKRLLLFWWQDKFIETELNSVKEWIDIRVNSALAIKNQQIIERKEYESKMY
jgi:hypothetical protein